MRLLPWEYAVRNLARSPMRLLISLVGSALVVLLVLAAGAFVRGMENSLGTSGQDRNVILLSAGSEESVERSEIAADVAGQILASVSGIQSRLSVPYVSPEIHMAFELRLSRQDPVPRPAVFRGITPGAFLVHPQVRVVEGRAPEPGRDEIMLGRLAATRMGIAEEQLAVGRTLWIDDRPWTICGRFEAPGSVMDAEIWLPLTDLQIAARRESLSCVVLTLGSGAFEDVDAFCKQRLDLELVAIRESDYYAKLADFYRPVRIIVWATAGLIALGGLFGGLNTLYAAFAARVREFAALQAIGFPRRAILLSLIQESLLASAAGALVAAALAVLLLDGVAVRVSMGAFGLLVDSAVLAWGLAAGFLLGMVGALPPAWRCLRLPITDALKAD